MNSFEEMGLRSEILSSLKDLGFETPTPIQAKAIPHLLSSTQDLIASAQTGTGKTAAFGLPAIQRTDISNKNTQSIVICPTRELCLQITRDLSAFAKYDKGLNILAVYGGSSIDTQIRALKRGVQIVVATPGRAIDLMKRKKLILEHVSCVILDEADEMLSMGFKDDLEAIFNATAEECQILLFSATMSKRVKTITKQYMKNPMEIAAAKVNMAAENVQHLYYSVRAQDRYEVLKRIADMNPDFYGITFCRTRRETKEVASRFMEDGYNADALHGDLSQSQRDEVMGKFRSGLLQILVATDVASRGLDVNSLTHVINYNLPDDPEVYVHRSGRTGRAGKHGTSIAIINNRERRKIKDIERISSIKFIQEQVPTGEEICRKQLYALIDKIKEINVDEEQIAPFLSDIYEKFEGLTREELIKHFVSSEFNRFLTYYKTARDINASSGRDRDRDRDGGRDRDRGRGRERGDRGDRGDRDDRRSAPFSRMFINVGGKQGLTPARLIGVINEGLDSSSASIGKIDIMKNFSFFDLEKNAAEPLINALQGESFEGVNLLVEVSQNKPNARGGGGASRAKRKVSKRRKRTDYKGEGRGRYRS